MSSFPTLKTGAVMQLPSSRSLQFSTDVVQFVDGSEQRFAAFAQPAHRWAVNYAQLDETELQNVRNFVRELDGSVQPFSFTDPWDSTVYLSCSLVTDVFTDAAIGLLSSNSHLLIQERRS